MAVQTGRPKRRKIRRQITLAPEDDARVRRLARQQGTTSSSIITDAIHSLPEPQDQWARMAPFAGILQGGGGKAIGDEETDLIIVGN